MNACKHCGQPTRYGKRICDDCRSFKSTGWRSRKEPEAEQFGPDHAGSLGEIARLAYSDRREGELRLSAEFWGYRPASNLDRFGGESVSPRSLFRGDQMTDSIREVQ